MISTNINMASKKVISVNESSLVDLKAELYRKETQLKREKVDNTQPKKAPIWQKKKKESKRKDGKTEKITSTDSTYDKDLEKSRLMLEAKSALYDKLSNGDIEVPSDEDEEDGRFLVDFHQKILPKTVENEDKKVIDSSQEIPSAGSPDEEWVEYVDSFGRSKMCLRKDLPQMKEKDGKVKLKSLEESKLTLLSDDMRRELIRKKWEQEVQEALDKPDGPIHYQDMFDETRDHGVGYYQFSKVEKEREEQQSALNKIRTQTEQQRSKREKLLEKRKAAMDVRLAKIRERKQRKLHEAGVVENTQEQDEKTEEQDEKTQEQDEKTQEQDEKTEEISSENEGNDEMSIGAMVERIRNKSTKIEKAHLNEWERGKVDLETFEKPEKKTPSYDPRSERDPQFAPPSFYTNEKKNCSRKPNWKADNQRAGIAGNTDVLNSQATGHNLNNQPTSEMCSNITNSSTSQTSIAQNYQASFDSTSSNIQNTNSYVQSTNPNVANTNPNLHNTNVYDQNTNPNVQNTHPIVHSGTNPFVHSTNFSVQNTFPNLPPPPIHTFPPPNFPPPLLPPPYQLPPQFPPNMPYPPYYPPPLPNNQQYNVPQKP